MAPAIKRKKHTNRVPLSSTPLCPRQQSQLDLAEIFNSCQHVTNIDTALNQITELHKTSNGTRFSQAFIKCFKKLLQSEQSHYSKTATDFVCKFLQHIHKNSLEDDNLIIDCIDAVDLYMQVLSDDCRLNSVTFFSKFIGYVDCLDEEICKALKMTLPKLIRDKKANIRAQAVLASRKFQDVDVIEQAFRFHFERDPELVVRKALLQVMDTKIFGYDFLVNSTLDSFEIMRTNAYARLGKISPNTLDSKQLHKVLHNGLNERERRASYSFKTHTLTPWLAQIHDGVNLDNLLRYFNVLDHHEDICRLLVIVFEGDLEKIENNGTTTRLHQVVEAFREKWLNHENRCLPNIETVEENIITIWLTLVRFCKKNQAIIKPVKIRTIAVQMNEEAEKYESIEKILDSQETPDEVVELYERLTPDLVHLVDFVKNFVKYSATVVKNRETNVRKLEYIYYHMMEFMMNYEIGDEVERKTVQEVLGDLLKKNLLTDRFENFIKPIVDCLCKLIYSSSSKLMISYISDLIQNVRSHLEDLCTIERSKSNSRRESNLENEVTLMSMVIDNEPRANGKFSSTMLEVDENSITESQTAIENKEDIRIFKHHTKELIKCLQMYFSCLQNARISEVPDTMLNHLMHLSMESLEKWYADNAQVRSLMIACNGITALIDEDFARAESTMTLFISACFDQTAIEIRTTGFKCAVDVIIQHENLEFPLKKLESFLRINLKEYGKFNRDSSNRKELAFAEALVVGATKLFYYQKIASPVILSHLIIWWYHPMTDSWLVQFIGIFLPLFVRIISKRSEECNEWLKELLVETFVESIQNCHDYILSQAFNHMSGADIQNLIHFLANLVPIAYHPEVANKVDDKIDELHNKDAADLIKYLKQSKSCLTTQTSTLKRSHLVQ